MSVKSMKCENCGGQIVYNGDQQLVCLNCGSLYSEKQDINKTYVSNTIVKNFYGTDIIQNVSSEKIAGLLFQAVNSIKNGNYSEARIFFVKVIEKDPYNYIATIFKGFIEKCQKQSNGRYKTTFTVDDMFTLLEYTINDENQNYYYDIFPYYKTLLKSIDPQGDEVILSLCDRYIQSLEEIEFDDVQDFVSELKKFKEAVNVLVKKTNIQKSREQRSQEHLYDVIKTNKALEVSIIIFVVIDLICLFFALK